MITSDFFIIVVNIRKVQRKRTLGNTVNTAGVFDCGHWVACRYDVAIVGQSTNTVIGSVVSEGSVRSEDQNSIAVIMGYLYDSHVSECSYLNHS
jgi:hypothetical protein